VGLIQSDDDQIDSCQRADHNAENQHIPAFDEDDSDTLSQLSSAKKQRDDLVGELSSLQRQFDITASSENQFRFSEEVQSAVSRGAWNGNVELLACKMCNKGFEDKRALHNHSVMSHQPDARFVRAGRPGSYQCIICQVIFSKRSKLNLHLYENHSEVEIRTNYNKTLDQLLKK
jgi:hypothetical protein